MTSPAGITVRGVGMVLGHGTRRVHALDNVTFEVKRGEFCCVIGPSGCGKSTLLSLIAGFFPPTEGTIRLNGTDACSPSPRRAIVFQEYALFPWLTAVGNVEFGLESRGVRDGRRAAALGYLGLVGLREFADVYPHELSGGMQQRVAIARALACEPEFLLMDEPLGALDALTRDQLQVLVVRLWQQFQQSVVYVTHNVSEATFLGDRVVVFTPRPGRIKAMVEIPLSRPRDPTDGVFVDTVARLTRLVTGEE